MFCEPATMSAFTHLRFALGSNFFIFFFYFEKSKGKKLKPFLIEKWSIFDCYVDYINNGSSETAQTTEFRNRMHLIFTESENRKVNIIVSLFSIVVCRSRRAFRRKRYFCQPGYSKVMFLIFQRLTTFILNLEKHPSCEMKVKKNRGKEPGSSHFTISIIISLFTQLFYFGTLPLMVIIIKSV